MGKKSKKKRVIQEGGKKGEIKDPSLKSREKEKGLNTWQIASLVLLIILPFLIYSNSLPNGFVFDDLPLISENPTITSLKNIPYLLGVKGGGASYRPLRSISYAIDYYFWGLNPVGYHLSNILFHIVTSLLVFGIVFHLMGSYWCAVSSALFFSLHPVQTDSVAYLSGRRDILCALFYLAGFYFFLRYREDRRLKYLLLTFFSYILSLASKEMGATLPLLLFIYDFVEVTSGEKGIWRSFKEVWSRYYPLYLPVFLVGVWFAYYKVFINYPSTRHEYYGGSIATNFLTVGKILIYYLKLILLPVVLNADYSFNAFPLSKGILETGTIFSFVILTGIFYLIVKLLAREKAIAFGLLWFFVTVLPVCQIFPHHELLAEHYLYLPMVGMSLIIGHAIGEVPKGYRFRRLFIGFYVITMIIFGVRVVDRNRDWRDGFTLWMKTVLTVPQCARAQDNLGVEYYNKGRYREAIACHETAIRFKPDYAIAYYNLGNAYNSSGLCEKAIKMYQESIRLRPDNLKAYNNLGVAYKNCKLYRRAMLMYLEVLEREPGNRSAINNMGAVLNSLNRFKPALYWCEKAVALNPRSVEGLQNLGIALSGLGNHERALSVLQSALALNPQNANIHVNLGSVYRRMGDDKKATEEYQLALQLSPMSAEALNNLGVVYNSKGLYDQAIDAYQKALTINPNDARVYCNLGAAYAGKGDYQKAIYQYKKTLEFNPKYSMAYNNLGTVYNNLKMYDEAITWYQWGIERAKNDPDMHFNLGVVYKNKGMEKEAISEYEEALRLKPEYADAHLNMSAIYLKNKERTKAVYHMKKYIQLTPNSPQADNVRKTIAELEQVK
jgi:tetratricopeptide (TPR) repeat protein